MKNVSIILLKKTSQPRKKQKLCLKKWQKIDKKVPKKSTQPRKKWNFVWKKWYFFTQKYLPAPQKTEILHEKMTKNWPKRASCPAKTEVFPEKNVFFTQKVLPAAQKTEILHEKITKKWQKGTKKSTQPRKNLKFCMKNWKPSYVPDPQLHQMFKPITKIFCTFLPI